jgi:hypothetical protein
LDCFANIVSDAERSREKVLRLDGERRHARQALITLLTSLVAEAHDLTAAAQNFDRESLARASAALKDMISDPTLDLARTAEVYGALRLAVAGAQPGRFADAGADTRNDTDSGITILALSGRQSSSGGWQSTPLKEARPSPGAGSIRWPHPAS